MIHYQLRCSKQHEFDGWFQSSTVFEKQAKAGLVECPECGDVKVSRALMAPAVSTREAEVRAPAQRAPEPPETPTASVPVPAPGTAVSGPMPAHIRAMLQRMRAEVEKHCDYVGPTFADEARKMHRGESEHRGIYGETTPAEAEALADEGIEVARMPWVPRAEG
ncbi:MAG TPA: DUF1178 family protein [Acetobacteraceae bacterium]|nr:DUF1178 family protein [Acetobacteraceae bacterium]